MGALMYWLRKIGLEQYGPLFAAHDVDFEALRLLNEQDLEKLGVSLGHRKKLLRALAEQGSGTHDAPVTTASTGAAEFQGERRQATVLFADLSGYTSMNERLDPEEVRAIVGRIKTEAAQAIEAHGGVVNQFVGDEIMALFGIPRAHEDDAIRAVRAAQQLHALVHDVSPNLEHRIGGPLRFHTGISSGLIVTSTADRRDGTYGVIGDAVNTGARLASHAQMDAILVSEETHRLIADFFETERLPSVELKGKAEPVTPYRVIRHTKVSSRFEAAAERGFTRYAGRDMELRALSTALRSARAGRGQFITVSGEPGVGKSRLLFEFGASLDRNDLLLEARCQSYGGDIPYLPFIDILRHRLGLDPATAFEQLHERVVVAVRRISTDLERFLPYYLHLLSIPSELHGLPSLHGEALRRAIEEALAELLTESARQRPLVAIFEDWHWADEASDTVLKYLADLVRSHSMEVIVTYRPDHQRPLLNLKSAISLVLEPLVPAETSAMLCSVWSAEAVPAALAARIHARTGGNALFTEELARQLLEDGNIRLQDGRAALNVDADSLKLPSSLHRVISARVDRLDPDCRETLRLASVIGRDFSRTILERLHPAPQHLSATLEALVRAGLIHPLPAASEPAYSFKHALVQDVVYESLLLSQRKALHEKAGAAFEALHADRLEEHYDRLADHYSRSSNKEKAIEYLERAADRSAALYTIRDALNKYSAVLDRLHDLSDEASKRRRIAVNIKLITAGWTQASPQFFAYLEESTRYARELRDDISLAQLAWAAGRLPWMLGDVAKGKGQLLEALRLAKDTRQGGLERTICMELVNVCTHCAEYAEALKFHEAAYDPEERSENLLTNTSSLCFQSWTLACLGHFTASRRALSTQSELAGALGTVFMQAWGAFWQGLNSAMQGNWETSLSGYDAAIPLFQTMGDSYGIGLTMAYRGHTNFMLGHTDEAKSDFEAKSLMQRSGSTLGRGWIDGREAEMLLCQGRYAEAQALTAEGLSLCAAGQRYAEVLLRVVGAAAGACLAGGLLADIAREIETAIGLACQRSERPQEAWARLRYAELLHRQGGSQTRALEEVMQAEQMFDDMDMPWWHKHASALRQRISCRAQFAGFVPGPVVGE